MCLKYTLNTLDVTGQTIGVDFDTFNLYKQKSIRHRAQKVLVSLSLFKRQRLQPQPWSVPLLWKSRWQGSPDICAEMLKPIITSLRLPRIPLDVHLSSQRAISQGNNKQPLLILLNSPGGGSRADMSWTGDSREEGGGLHLSSCTAAAAVSIHMVKPVSAGLMHMQQAQTGYTRLLLHFNGKAGNGR